MTREEKLQEIVEYNPCRVERSAVLRYLLAVRRNDTEQIAYFESFGKSVRHIILNVRTYERGMIFGYVGKQFNEHGWINGMLPIIEEIKLDTFNTIHIAYANFRSLYQKFGNSNVREVFDTFTYIYLTFRSCRAIVSGPFA